MQVKTNSWHFKVATRHGGLYHDYRCWSNPPTSCNYLLHILVGLIVFFFSEVIGKKVIPVIIDCIFLLLIFAVFKSFLELDILLSVILIMILCLYGIVTSLISDLERDYYGPFFVFKNSKFVKKITAACKPIDIVYVQEKS